MQTKSAMEINPAEFSHRASVYLLGVASAYHVTPDEALKVVLEAVAKRMMPSFEPHPIQGRVTKEDIKQWLKNERKDREWLAEQCCIGKRAVDKWLSTAREIPPAKLKLIEQLMEKAVWKEVCHA